MVSHTTKRLSVSRMTKIAMLSVLSFVLMQFELMVPLFPGFLKIDASDLPALIAGFAMGPLAGIGVAAVKNILHLLQTSTGGVGELANFLIGVAMIVPSALIYKRRKSKEMAILGLLVGTIAMAAMGGFANYFILIPFYQNFMPIEAIVGMGTAVNGAIHSVETLVLFGVVPFNLFKGAILAALTVILYKHISPILSK